MSSSSRGRRESRRDEEAHLPNDYDISTLGDLLLKRRVLEERLGSEVCRSNVGVETERLSQLEESLLRSNGSNAPLGSSDGS